MHFEGPMNQMLPESLLEPTRIMRVHLDEVGRQITAHCIDAHAFSSEKVDSNQIVFISPVSFYEPTIGLIGSTPDAFLTNRAPAAHLPQF